MPLWGNFGSELAAGAKRQLNKQVTTLPVAVDRFGRPVPYGNVWQA